MTEMGLKQLQMIEMVLNRAYNHKSRINKNLKSLKKIWELSFGLIGIQKTNKRVKKIMDSQS